MATGCSGRSRSRMKANGPSANRPIEASNRRGGLTVLFNVNSGRMAIAKTERNGKTLHITYAQVEVEFVINTNGTVWGDSKSPAYLQLVATRKWTKDKEKTQVRSCSQ